MKLKTFGKISLVCVLLMGLAACSKDKKEEEAKVDPRDAFVGTYAYEATGELIIQDLPELLALWDTIPIDQQGEAKIAKEGDANKIIMVADIFGDTLRAEVTGNQFRLDNNSVSRNFGDLKITGVVTNDRANLAGNQIYWESDVMANLTLKKLSLSKNGDGHLKITATKK